MISLNRTSKYTMASINSLNILLISLLLLTSCATSTASPHSQSGCPRGTVRIQDEDTGKYDCASQQEYEEIRDIMDEHS